MIHLAAAGTVQGSATNTGAVTYTLFGMELSAGPTQTYKPLAQGQLPSSVGTLYTVPASTAALVKGIHLASSSASVQTVGIYVNGALAANKTMSLQLPANGSALYDGQWTVYDAFGNIQAGMVTGYALDSAVVHLAGSETITGAKQFNANLTMRGPRPWVDVTAYGADPTGVVDSTAAIQAAITAAGSGQVFIPAGAYVIGTGGQTGFTTAGAVTIMGAGTINTLLVTGHPTADVFQVDDSGCRIESFSIWSSYVDTTAGGTLSGVGQTITSTTTIPVTFPASATVSIALTNGTFTPMTYTARTSTTFTGCTGSGAFSAGARIYARSGGYAISNPGQFGIQTIRDMRIENMYAGMQWGGVEITVTDCTIYDLIDRAIVLNFQDAGLLVNNLVADNRIAAKPLAGIDLQIGGAIVSNCGLMRFQHGMRINPLPGGVWSVFCHDTFFDQNVLAGLTISGTSGIQRSKWVNCWMSSSPAGSGVVLNNVNSSGIDFIGCDFYANGAYGIQALACSEWSMQRCRVAQNATAGVDITASSPAPEFAISDCLIGPEAAGGFGANGIGIRINAGTYANILIADNMLAGNTGAALIDNSTVNSPNQKSIVGNTGLSVIPRPMIATPATFAVETVVHTMPLPANSLLVGTTIRVRAAGVITATTPTITARLRLGTAGTTADAQVCASAAGTVTTGGGWAIDGIMTVRSIGSGGTVMGNIGVFSTVASAGSAQTATVAANTTVALILSLTITGGGTSPVVTVVNAAFDVLQQ